MATAKGGGFIICVKRLPSYASRLKIDITYKTLVNECND